MDAPPLPRSYYSSWGEGSGHLDVIMHSTPTSTDPQRIDRAEITFQQNNKCILIGAPPEMENVVDLTSPVHETWLEGLQVLASFEQTAAAQAISAHIRSTPYLPVSLQDHFINAIFAEAQDAARIAASRGHRAVSIAFHLYISVDMLFDDDYVDDSSAEDEADVEAGNAGMDAAAAMGLGDAGVDAAMANVEEDAPFGVVEIEIMAGIDVVEPVDLEAGEIVGGLSPEAIANHLTVDELMGGDPVACVICLENMAVGTPAGRLPCGHVFHPSCITVWLERSGTCPICRHQFD
ncbi:hypothetical protein COCNU_scaffold011582G000030 [Cocos nucifera]|nr:hypothetical protein [Cocos nucifera]